MFSELDYESQSEYIVTVIARDQGATAPQQSTVNVTIKIIDSNDNAPVFAIPLPLIVDVPSSLIAGAKIAKVTATDADSPGVNSHISYRYGVSVCVSLHISL